MFFLFFIHLQIKIEPPDIRDIDEDVPAGWDSPGRLVIDLVRCLNITNFLNEKQ